MLCQNFNFILLHHHTLVKRTRECCQTSEGTVRWANERRADTE